MEESKLDPITEDIFGLRTVVAMQLLCDNSLTPKLINLIPGWEGAQKFSIYQRESSARSTYLFFEVEGTQIEDMIGLSMDASSLELPTTIKGRWLASAYPMCEASGDVTTINILYTEEEDGKKISIHRHTMPQWSHSDLMNEFRMRLSESVPYTFD